MIIDGDLDDFVTTHAVYPESSERMSSIADASVALIVTSPPYPMIALWDQALSELQPDAGEALAKEAGYEAFEALHRFLDKVWEESFRVLAPGGILCVNIGDATRKLGGHFRLYSNHTRILSAAMRIGFDTLPGILWRKPTNAPNKFMGSGMLPGGAYLTLEHEHILVLRKGGPRSFESPEEKANRRRSAYFWEERNSWFSDIWDILGVRQTIGAAETGADLKALRGRSAAFPLEIPYRLIAMFSVYGDTVLDPFWGTGTTSLAAAALGRNSRGYEILPALAARGTEALASMVPASAELVERRLRNHQEFIDKRLGLGKVFKYKNSWSGMPVVTGQETDIVLVSPERAELANGPGGPGAPPEVTVRYHGELPPGVNHQNLWNARSKTSRMGRQVLL